MSLPATPSSTSSNSLAPYVKAVPFVPRQQLVPLADSSTLTPATSSVFQPPILTPIIRLPNLHNRLLQLASNAMRQDIIHLLSEEAELPPEDLLEKLRQKKEGPLFSLLCRFARSHHLSLIPIQPSGHVGELQERWPLPTDHLPVGLHIDGIEFASFNPLNSEYIPEWVLKRDSQGLRGSYITRLEEQPTPFPGLTQRNLATWEMIRQMLFHPHHPKSVIALQECSEPFTQFIQQQLKTTCYQLVHSQAKTRRNQHLLIFDSTRFALQEADCSFTYSCHINKPLLVVLLEERSTHQLYQLFNLHIPIPNKVELNPRQGLQEFFSYAISQIHPNAHHVLLGDFNFPAATLHHCFTTNNPDPSLIFETWGTYNTVISPRPHLHGERVDFIALLGRELPFVLERTPDDVLVGLSTATAFLQPKDSLPEL